MRFWDSSALVPLFVGEEHSELVRGFIAEDAAVAIWWGSAPELWSAFARLRREDAIDAATESRLLDRFERARAAWLEILPDDALRRRSGQLLRIHPLRAADALQLAAALAWARDARADFVTLDERLAQAARLEGLTVLPD